MNPRTRRACGIMAVALFAAFSQAAVAQPGGGAPLGHGRGIDIEQVIASLKTELNLNTSQQVMWDNAVLASRSARASGRAAMERVHAALKAELAKQEPDFAAVATLADNAQASAQALRKQVRDEWLRLYATFSPAQKSVVREAIRTKVERMETFREKMKERFPQRPAAG